MRSTNQIPTTSVEIDLSKPGTWRGHAPPLGFRAAPGKPIYGLGSGQCAEYEGNHGSWYVCCRSNEGAINCYRLTHDVGHWETPAATNYPTIKLARNSSQEITAMPPRIRQRRPIMTAMKNPCGCKKAASVNPEFPMPKPGIPQIHLVPGALQPIQANFPVAPAPQQAQPQPQQIQQPLYQYPYNFPVPVVADEGAWLPASTGPQPAGASTWILWSGGATGTKIHAGGGMTEPVSILETSQGGPSGTLVRTSVVLRNPTAAGAGVTQTQPQFQTAAAQNQQWQSIYDNARAGYLPSSYGRPQRVPDGAGGWICDERIKNPTAAGPGVTQTQPAFQTPAAQNQQWQAIADNAVVGNLGSAWLPASTGPQPPGVAIWIEWSGGSSGTRRYAGSAVTQPVTILQHAQGGPTGVLVLVSPSVARERNQAGHHVYGQQIRGAERQQSVGPNQLQYGQIPQQSQHCWGPAWDRSCKICLPFPSGEKCVSYKVNGW